MVRKINLLLIASIVWLVAGFNVIKIGVETYTNHLSALNFIVTILVFLIFWFLVFHKLTVKHTRRISNYKKDRQFILNFFDLKSFLIMAVMITGGLLIRKFNLLPDRFIAVFYTGLGSALFLAGILFGYNYLERRQWRK